MTRSLVALVAIAASVLRAQTPVAPSPQETGPRRGQNVGDYNVTQFWELGYRFLDTRGNRERYRSDVNYRNGIRLLGGRLTVDSRDGQAGVFDHLSLNVLGLASDPYQFSNLRVEKNRWYRVDSLWRSNDYFNSALPISFGQHRMDTTHRLQDHDLTILPQSRIRFFAGFSRSSQSGPVLSTTQQFDAGGSEFPIFANLRTRQNEFRVGNEVQFFGVKLHWIRAWENYREDTPEQLSQSTALTSFNRNGPYRGTTPSWRVNVLRELGRYWAFNARFANSTGRRNFTLREAAAGPERLGGDRSRQVLVAGDARRPVTTANITLSFFPVQSVTITNHTAFHQTRMEGNAAYTEVDTVTQASSTVSFQYLGIRAITNSTDLQWRITKWASVRSGYQYSERRIRSLENAVLDGFESSISGEQENRLHAASAGFQLRPLKGLSLIVDGEIGRNSRPFYPVSEKDYHGLSARATYRTKTVAISALAQANYNFNSLSLFSHSARARQFAGDLSWTPRDWFALEAGYSKQHLDTMTGLAFFATSQLVSGERSLYITNLHAAHAGIRLDLRRRADLYLGYSHTEDAGGATAVPSSLPAILAARTYPMTFLSPQARLSLRLHEKLRWNAGYQFYGYHEHPLPVQNYRAHTAFTSVLWSF